MCDGLTRWEVRTSAFDVSTGAFTNEQEALTTASALVRLQGRGK